jgi:hypothetical protein
MHLLGSPFEKLESSVIGASRRTLREIFGGEYGGAWEGDEVFCLTCCSSYFLVEASSAKRMRRECGDFNAIPGARLMKLRGSFKVSSLAHPVTMNERLVLH